MQYIIAFGANLGDPQQQFETCKNELIRHFSIQNVTSSHLYRTKAATGTDKQPEYLNGCFLVETEISPAELHVLLQEIETHHGRSRTQKWGARKIDLDIVLAEDEVISTDSLSIPHPRMHYRRFVLEPLLEVCPDAVHPVLKTTVHELNRTACNKSPHFLIVGSKSSEELNAESKIESIREILHSHLKHATLDHAVISDDFTWYHLSTSYIGAIIANLNKTKDIDYIILIDSPSKSSILSPDDQRLMITNVQAILPVVDLTAMNDTTQLRNGIDAFCQSLCEPHVYSGPQSSIE